MMPKGAVWIVCAGRTATAGGIGRCVANLVRGLPAAAPGLALRVVDTRGSGHIALAPFTFAGALARIALGGARGRIALLHVNLASRGSTLRKFVVVALGGALRVPVVIHLHGALFDTFYRALPRGAQAAVRWMFARAERVIVLGPYWRRFLVEDVGVPAEKIAVIANGVARPAACAADPDPAHILFLGRLEARKGVPELLAALGSPSLSERRWTATLAGDGDVAGFADQARRLGIDGRVRFPGWVDAGAVEALLGSASLLVLPSHAEGLPMAVIEALAHRVAVVTTPVGAMPDFLEHGVSVAFTPAGDAAALAATLAGLLDDPAMRARIAEAGQAVFARAFDIETACRRVEAVYAAVLGRPAMRVVNFATLIGYPWSRRQRERLRESDE